MMLIGFMGKIGSGKSTAAKYLVDVHGFERIRFAGPLKAMLRMFLVEIGVDGFTVDRMIEGDLKELPSKHLGGKTPRWAMQALGTEWGRNLLSEDLWIDAWKSQLMIYPSNPVVCDDCRFPNEAKAIHDHGGIIIQMCNNNLPPSISTHISEEQEFWPDVILGHDGKNLETIIVPLEAILRASTHLVKAA